MYIVRTEALNHGQRDSGVECHGIQARTKSPASSPARKSGNRSKSTGSVSVATVERAVLVPPPGLHRISNLIGALYDSANEKTPWQTFLEALRSELRAGYVFFLLKPPSAVERGKQIVASGGKSFEVRDEYFDYGYSLDLFVSLPEEKVVTADEFLGATRWTTSRFFQDFVQEDMRFFLGFDFRTEDGTECRVRVCRAREMEDFSAPEKSLCQIVLPHLKRAVKLHARIDTHEARRMLYQESVDRLPLGMLVLDGAGRVTKVNAAAVAVLRENDGLRVINGALKAHYVEDNAALSQLLGKAMEWVPGEAWAPVEPLLIRKPSFRHSLGLHVRPIAAVRQQDTANRAVAVYIRDPDLLRTGSHDVLRRVFKLSSSQAKVAMLVSEGLTATEISEELMIQKNTVRTHLRAIYFKTGVSRQSELVSLILKTLLWIVPPRSSPGACGTD